MNTIAQLFMKGIAIFLDSHFKQIDERINLTVYDDYANMLTISQHDHGYAIADNDRNLQNDWRKSANSKMQVNNACFINQRSIVKSYLRRL